MTKQEKIVLEKIDIKLIEKIKESSPYIADTTNSEMAKLILRGALLEAVMKQKDNQDKKNNTETDMIKYLTDILSKGLKNPKSADTRI